MDGRQNGDLQLLQSLAGTALAAAAPEICLPALLPPRPAGRLVLLAAGKAAPRMTAAALSHYGGAVEGICVSPYGHDGTAGPTPGIQRMEASHPAPDSAGLSAADRFLSVAEGLEADDLLLCLLSGGASALLPAPVHGISLRMKQALTAALLRSGAPIRAINTVRKHLSRIKGGHLAATAFPARTVTLAMSDVPGDDPSSIASGPTAGDSTTGPEAIGLLRRYEVDPEPALLRALQDPANETPKPGDPRLARTAFHLAGCAEDMLGAVLERARKDGFETTSWGGRVEGEAREIAGRHAEQILSAPQAAHPVLYVSGGELTVTGAGGGAGGRCREYLLALMLALGGKAVDFGISALAMDTDGIDGSPDAAGALMAPHSLSRAQALGMDCGALLTAHRSGEVFARLGLALPGRPSGINISDLRLILVRGPRGH